MIAVISHDAGGAENLSSYIRQQAIDCYFVLAGPAQKIFERKLGSVKIGQLDEAIKNSDWILCGTGWQTDLEFNAIKLARSLGKRSVAFLDHWVNYKERFTRDEETCLPDEIWVGDVYAETLAKKIFPTILVKLVPNPYFLDIKNELSQLETRQSFPGGKASILYVCEPVSEHAKLRYGDPEYWGYTEESALRYFLTNINSLDIPLDRIIIRRHPSEVAGKYLWAQREFDLPIIQSDSGPLLNEVSESDIVVGCGSMAMVVGLLAGKEVISCIPPGGKPCVLPYQEIIRFEEILGNKTTLKGRR